MLRRSIDTVQALRMLILYMDGQGDASEREIIPLALVSDRESRGGFRARYMIAHCETARASRTFRLDRIHALADATTGEELNLWTWLNTLPLGPAHDFTWEETHERPPGPVRTEAPRAIQVHDIVGPDTSPIHATRRKRRWKLILLLFVLGYAIGRLRLIRAVILLTHYRHGLWL